MIKGTGFSLEKNDVKVQVDGVSCKVSESTLNEIKCTLEAKTSQSARLTSNAATPTNQYISGSGFFYQRFSLDGFSPRNIAGFKEALETKTINMSCLQDEYISGELKTDDVFGGNYA